MADPQVINIPEWAWLKVATNVNTGVITRLDSTVYYYQTYRETGEAAPPAPTPPSGDDRGIIPEEAVRLFDRSNQAQISAVAPIDVYIMCQNPDLDSNDQGKIRVDL